jgi:hypothetical protein
MSSKNQAETRSEKQMVAQGSELRAQQNPEKKSFLKKWFGAGLIIFATLFIPALFYVQFLSLTLKQKGIVTLILVIGGQALTWLGIALLGKQLYQDYRKKLFNWLKKYFGRLLTKK